MKLYLKSMIASSFLVKRFPYIIKNYSDIELRSHQIKQLIGKEEFDLYYKKIKKEAESQIYCLNSDFILSCLENKYRELNESN